ncbi:AbrB/MazE/SpoVT family DNA-binding domain-containing protein [Thermus brockianus]|uniref:AbrB/MazE/SpoVT family DNA-binding domain-containing protein n=1 Tax=Thermus brockianus TaxID=56956 RepID=UPI001FCBF8B9|nr:AbrB/MazE/SpoVT family DNA-binding domain-containing protein [Thermus brockianus]
MGRSECIKIITQVSPKGQITLPASVRKALGLQAGDALLLWVRGGLFGSSGRMGLDCL